jgi:hypothetical protein
MERGTVLEHRGDMEGGVMVRCRVVTVREGG